MSPLDFDPDATATRIGPRAEEPDQQLVLRRLRGRQLSEDGAMLATSLPRYRVRAALRGLARQGLVVRRGDVEPPQWVLR